MKFIALRQLPSWALGLRRPRNLNIGFLAQKTTTYVAPRLTFHWNGWNDHGGHWPIP
jgi:hypothetical protein